MIDAALIEEYRVWCEKMRAHPHSRGGFETDGDLALLNAFAARAPLSKSQLFQDLMVLHKTANKRNGYFVEFGACDGLYFSNTYLLEKAFGWRGIVAEPAPIWRDGLFRNRSCFISTKCVFTESGQTLTFNQTTTDAALSTIDAFTTCDSHAGIRAEGLRHEVETISLNDLLAQANAPHEIDYMSIDTEGSELDILSRFDFSAYDVNVISVEHNYTAAREQIYNLLSARGFRRDYVRLSFFDDWYFREA